MFGEWHLAVFGAEHIDIYIFIAIACNETSILVAAFSRWKTFTSHFIWTMQWGGAMSTSANNVNCSLAHARRWSHIPMTLSAGVPLKLIFIPGHTKSGGVLCYTLRTLSVRPSVSALFPCSNFITFWPIFFKLCIYIGIGEEWYGIASGLILFWNNRVMALDLCQKCFVLRFRALTLVPIFFKLCIDIGIGQEWYGIASGIISFRNNRVMALDLCPKCIFGQYLKNE